MLFNSLDFVLFFFVVVLIYFSLPKNVWRKTFLLFASYYFYASWNIVFLAILVFETMVAYGYGYMPESKRNKTSMLYTVCLLLLPLICFKYLNFLLMSVQDTIQLTGLMISVPKFILLLPVGISFYTFMAVGYVVDVYKKKVLGEKSILNFALFIGFFPQIASGPIGRASQLIPQFQEKQMFSERNLYAGIRMMLWGYFMKFAIGDRAGIYVETVFGNYLHHNGTSLILATFMYTIQIYCDFAGYSLIAIGTARIMGYELMDNFKRPYFATSIGDFWRRWHISLSTWFRDYVYIPCGGSRVVGKIKLYRNLLITFIVSGLWHGAAYNFILWGTYHALCQIIKRFAEPYKIILSNNTKYRIKGRVKRVFDILFTFILVCYGWMMFYAPNLDFIIDVTKGYMKIGKPYIHQTTIFFFTIAFFILVVKEIREEFFCKQKDMTEITIHSRLCFALKYVALAVFTVWISVLSGGQFIYFQF